MGLYCKLEWWDLIHRELLYRRKTDIKHQVEFIRCRPSCGSSVQRSVVPKLILNYHYHSLHRLMGNNTVALKFTFGRQFLERWDMFTFKWYSSGCLLCASLSSSTWHSYGSPRDQRPFWITKLGFRTYIITEKEKKLQEASGRMLFCWSGRKTCSSFYHTYLPTRLAGPETGKTSPCRGAWHDSAPRIYGVPGLSSTPYTHPNFVHLSTDSNVL